MTLTGCTKDSMFDLTGLPEGAFLLTAERKSQDHGTKTAAQGNRVYWVNGDQVYLRGNTYSVTVDNGKAYISGAPSGEGDIYGYYPATIKPDSPNQDNVTISIPNNYTSSFVGGRQIIQLPMIGKAAADASGIEFKHLTAAMFVRIKNTSDYDLVLDAVSVSSANQKLCGSTVLHFDQENFGFYTGGYVATDAAKQVTVNFSDSPVIGHGGSNIKEVQVPILPINSGDLTISVYAHRSSDTYVDIEGVPSVRYSIHYTYSATNSSIALGRNEMLTAQIVLTNSTPTETLDNSQFSVSATKKVRFSKGNLQYIGSAATPYWKFADHQYDFIGGGEGTGQYTDASNVDRDLFGWGTSGYNDKFPYMTSATNTDYGNGNADIANTMYDWGKNNAISNGGNAADQWRTLTQAEWKYLLVTRTDAVLKFGYAQVAGVNGMVILPDSFIDPKKNNGSDAFVPSNNDSPYWTNNIYTAENWLDMETAGAIFLPAAGCRGNYSSATNYNSRAGRGYYWSSTRTLSTNAINVYFYYAVGSSRMMNSNDNRENRYYGCSVRLVKDVE